MTGDKTGEREQETLHSGEITQDLKDAFDRTHLAADAVDKVFAWLD